MIWREKRIVLAVLGVLLIANTLFFFTYRVQYEKRLQDLDTRLHSAEEQLQRAHNGRVSAEQQLAAYLKVQQDLQTLYNQRWATESQRLTALINEVKRLAVASQLVPRTYSFNKQEDTQAQKSGRIGTDTVIISFTVQGNYQQIRRLVNLLELSNQFVIIDAITLAGSGGSDSTLTMNLRLKTLFREPPRGAAVNQQM
ncbi:MAG: hypothetical protein DMF57_04075 [Acidobacteria bacterium]|nr:MAG: hypothetical protein DMF57_04075 [Acidobacteriota bacterium]